MNLLHMWFPGGMALGAALSFLIDKAELGSAAFAAWQMKLALVLVPTIAYGILFTGQKFPKTEQAASGQSFGDMCSGTFGSLAFWLLFIAMGISASIELGPGNWMRTAMEEQMKDFAGKGAGALVVVYTSVLVMVMRLFAGSLASKLSPVGLLLASAVLSAVGLFGLTKVQGAGLIIVLATVYAVGYCYFWPTTLGVTSMWVKKGGALAMSIVNGWGMAVVGLVAAPLMGKIADLNLDIPSAVAAAEAATKKALEEGLVADKVAEAGAAAAKGAAMLVSFQWVAASAIILIALYCVCRDQQEE
jgi:hypothetical protein